MTEARTTYGMDPRGRLPSSPVSLPRLVVAALLIPLALVGMCVALQLAPSQLDKERDALIAFYHATGGENWRVNTNWLSDKRVGTWHGVGQVPRGRVTRLDLANNGLRGPMPDALGDLKYLEGLDLSENELRGPIPSALGNLTRLRFLILSGNGLSGPIPAQLGNLGLLLRLDLGHNQLSGPIPVDLENLVFLSTLFLDHNQLTGPIPVELGDIGLSRLALEQNHLGGCIPHALQDVPTNDLGGLNLPFCN